MKRKLKAVDSFAPEFVEEFPVNKDMQSLRKKDVLLEDVLHDLRELYEFIHESAEDHYPRYYTNFCITKDRQIGYWFLGVRSGIPSFVIGVKTEEAWKELKKKLQEKGHIR